MSTLRTIGICGVSVTLICALGAGANVSMKQQKLQLQADRLALTRVIDAALNPLEACKQAQNDAKAGGNTLTACASEQKGEETKLKLELEEKISVLGLTWKQKAKSAARVKPPSGKEIEHLITSHPDWNPNATQTGQSG